MNLPTICFENPPADAGQSYWDTALVNTYAAAEGDVSLRSVERAIDSASLLPVNVAVADLKDEFDRPATGLVVTEFDRQAKAKRHRSWVLQLHCADKSGWLLLACDARKARRWRFLDVAADATPNAEQIFESLVPLIGERDSLVWPHGAVTAQCRELVANADGHRFDLGDQAKLLLGLFAFQPAKDTVTFADAKAGTPSSGIVLSDSRLSHLQRLEAESMHIMREVVAQAENPVMLYSVGKDSSVMLHLAKKAFYPSPPPFPLLHVDTRWKFQAMYRFREEAAKDSGMELLRHINPEAIEKDINPFDHGSALHTDITKTQGLKQALDMHKFDVAFGGARRDEEKSRAKERVFSFRTAAHRWDPKNQRPELWNLYNASKNPGESIRVFPLSNWTELDIWQYIYQEQVPLVPLYFAQERAVVERDGMLIHVDDDRMQLFPGEAMSLKRVRFRTLGCYPLTGAVESDATDLPAVVLELLASRTSERQGRAIDSDASASMEQKKQEGYF